MRLTFVHWVVDDRGSAQDIAAYASVARALGHSVTLYGPPDHGSSFDYSLDVGSTDAVIFIFEWTTELQHGDNLDLLRLVARVPRDRRLVIDCDGKYNDAICVIGDSNHPDAHASRSWVELCDALADKIFQPTFHPLRTNVGTFLFHAYDPGWEAPLNPAGKDYGMYYVGNNWFRWAAMRRMLEVLEPIRDEVGRIALVGHGWDSPAPWANPTISADAYAHDPAFLHSLGVEVEPPIRFDQVIASMGKGRFMPVMYRPLFDHLRLVTCRTFETPAANTIPVFTQDPAFVAEIYGDDAVELVLPDEEPHEKILEMIRRPQRYAATLERIRRHLRERHSYRARVQQLIEMVDV